MEYKAWLIDVTVDQLGAANTLKIIMRGERGVNINNFVECLFITNLVVNKHLMK